MFLLTLRHARLRTLSTIVVMLAAVTAGPASAHHTPEHSRAMGAPSASAGDPASQGLSASGCWVRTMPVQLPSAAYLTLRNDGAQRVTLTDVRSDAFEHVMMHNTQKEGGMAKMVMVHDLPLAPGAQIRFAPGGMHVMLERASRELAVGQTVPLQLVFGDDGALDVQCELRPASTVAH